MSCEDTIRTLDAYVDRELEPESARRVSRHLESCDRCGRRLMEREGLARLVAAAPYFQAPERLRTRVSKAALQSRSRPWWFTGAAAASVVLVLGAGVLFRSTAGGGYPVTNEVVTGHLRSLMADHLVDVPSTDQHTVKPWFLGKLDFSPPVVDLASLGYPLAGGRVDYLDGRPVAALVYRRRQHAINVFVAPVGDRTILTEDTRSIRGFHVHHWRRDDLAFWAVSDLKDDELTEFVRALRGS